MSNSVVESAQQGAVGIGQVAITQCLYTLPAILFCLVCVLVFAQFFYRSDWVSVTATVTKQSLCTKSQGGARRCSTSLQYDISPNKICGSSTYVTNIETPEEHGKADTVKVKYDPSSPEVVARADEGSMVVTIVGVIAIVVAVLLAVVWFFKDSKIFQTVAGVGKGLEIIT
jgi:hypothetical protein